MKKSYCLLFIFIKNYYNFPNEVGVVEPVDTSELGSDAYKA